MTASADSFGAGSISTAAPVSMPVSLPGSDSADLISGLKKTDYFVPPKAVAGGPYSGRVSTFFSADRASYCETYEPARQTIYGPVCRVESRVVGSRWRHVAYRASGQSVLSSLDDLVLFDQTSLPLLFVPENEIAFVQKIVSSFAGAEHLNLTRDLIVYVNKDRTSYGIVRLKLDI